MAAHHCYHPRTLLRQLSFGLVPFEDSNNGERGRYRQYSTVIGWSTATRHQQLSIWAILLRLLRQPTSKTPWIQRLHRLRLLQQNQGIPRTVSGGLKPASPSTLSPLKEKPHSKRNRRRRRREKQWNTHTTTTTTTTNHTVKKLRGGEKVIISRQKHWKTSPM